MDFYIASHRRVHSFRHLFICLTLSSALAITSTGITHIMQLIGAIGRS